MKSKETREGVRADWARAVLHRLSREGFDVVILECGPEGHRWREQEMQGDKVIGEAPDPLGCVPTPISPLIYRTFAFAQSDRRTVEDLSKECFGLPSVPGDEERETDSAEKMRWITC